MNEITMQLEKYLQQARDLSKVLREVQLDVNRTSDWESDRLDCLCQCHEEIGEAIDMVDRVGNKLAGAVFYATQVRG